ncbi:prostaglandin E receptor 1c (subtype EP1) [Poecilia latipinna]|uniref:prostaglandin E receptor 1c (subtype EP1) n=1 Tax=Poecilia latipinna TaxID=48699 RepID=UPI00072EBD6E|nr:PREDICTED: prostaglandin E2 receptor EP1 subtype-like [Poecilia latipinna]XP_014886678.1 PREDICTED: prostaglandin E2 receptor EP1 subtype-like [Poecilia latipinna]
MTTPSVPMNGSLLNVSATNSTFIPKPFNGLGMSLFTMLFGAVSNLTALGILARSRSRFRRQSKKSFLLLTVALLVADLLGHVILGAFALHVHLNPGVLESGENFCDVFGASMVFFGLCSLFFGFAMAVERCVAITQPFFHASMVTAAHAKSVVLLLSTFALLLALSPFFSRGSYFLQFPKTWCFFPIERSTDYTTLVLVFSSLGLFALFFSLFCNIVSGLALLHARIKSRKGNTTPSGSSGRRASTASSTSWFCTLDVEMMVQLAAVTVVSCVCWGPFLIHIFIKQFKMYTEPDKLVLIGLRMAAWNQILDPWVYILLRRKMLTRLCCAHYYQGIPTSNNSLSETRRNTINLQ